MGGVNIHGSQEIGACGVQEGHDCLLILAH